MNSVRSVSPLPVFISLIFSAVQMVGLTSWPAAAQMPGLEVTPPMLPTFEPTEEPVSPLIENPNHYTSPPMEIPDEYTLSAGDRINVIIANVPEYSGVFQILVDGTVNLPILGTMQLEGMTIRTAAEAIARQYEESELLVYPVVDVVLAEANLLNVAVIGEVNRPGVYSITPNNGKFPTVAQAIDQAGGITQLADLQQIEIYRPSANSTEVIEVNLWSLLTEGDLSQNVTLRDGDSIVLRTADSIDPEMAGLAGSSNLSPGVIQINVMGEVNQPGLLQVSPNTSLNQALMTVGGFTNRSRRGSVELVRLNPNGTVSSRRVDIDLTSDVNDETNPLLHNRDVIIVGRSTIAQITDTLSNIMVPLGGAFSLFNLFSPFFSSPSSSSGE